MDFATRLKEARKESGLTQEQLATECGLATITIRQYELGKRQPRYETVEKIAAVLRTSTGRLLNKGGKLKYHIKRWKSKKDARLEIAIDAELLEQIKWHAKNENLSLEDEVEKILYDFDQLWWDEHAEETST